MGGSRKARETLLPNGLAVHVQQEPPAWEDQKVHITNLPQGVGLDWLVVVLAPLLHKAGCCPGTALEMDAPAGPPEQTALQAAEANLRIAPAASAWRSAGGAAQRTRGCTSATLTVRRDHAARLPSRIGLQGRDGVVTIISLSGVRGSCCKNCGRHHPGACKAAHVPPRATSRDPRSPPMQQSHRAPAPTQATSSSNHRRGAASSSGGGGSSNSGNGSRASGPSGSNSGGSGSRAGAWSVAGPAGARDAGAGAGRRRATAAAATGTSSSSGPRGGSADTVVGGQFAALSEEVDEGEAEEGQPSEEAAADAPGMRTKAAGKGKGRAVRSSVSAKPRAVTAGRRTILQRTATVSTASALSTVVAAHSATGAGLTGTVAPVAGSAAPVSEAGSAALTRGTTGAATEGGATDAATVGCSAGDGTGATSCGGAGSALTAAGHAATAGSGATSTGHEGSTACAAIRSVRRDSAVAACGGAATGAGGAVAGTVACITATPTDVRKRKCTLTPPSPAASLSARSKQTPAKRRFTLRNSLTPDTDSVDAKAEQGRRKSEQLAALRAEEAARDPQATEEMSEQVEAWDPPSTLESNGGATARLAPLYDGLTPPPPINHGPAPS